MKKLTFIILTLLFASCTEPKKQPKDEIWVTLETDHAVSGWVKSYKNGVGYIETLLAWDSTNFSGTWYLQSETPDSYGIHLENKSEEEYKVYITKISDGVKTERKFDSDGGFLEKSF